MEYVGPFLHFNGTFHHRLLLHFLPHSLGQAPRERDGKKEMKEGSRRNCVCFNIGISTKINQNVLPGHGPWD